MRRVCRSNSLLQQKVLRLIARRLIEGIDATYLLADRGHDSDAIVAQATSQDMIPVIPPRKNRNDQRYYDKDIYK